MTEAFDTTGSKINLVAHPVDNIIANHKGEGRIAPVFTPKELAELKATDERRARIEADAPYLGWPKPAPLFTHKNPLVNEVAKILWESGL